MSESPYLPGSPGQADGTAAVDPTITELHQLFDSAHKLNDKDFDGEAMHHSLGNQPYQAAPGTHRHKTTDIIGIGDIGGGGGGSTGGGLGWEPVVAMGGF